jgi:hypothetical protein
MIKNFGQFLNENDVDARIFCDMDGVLCDFDKAFKSSNDDGLSFEEYDKVNGKGSGWAIISKQGEGYWSNLEWMPDGKELWDYLNTISAPTILSSPSREYSSIKGKMKWINVNLGISQDTPTTKSKDWDKSTRIILSSHKHLYVLPDPNVKSILIDDTQSKIDKWTEAGGIGILHTSTVDTISKLQDIIKQYGI